MRLALLMACIIAASALGCAARPSTPSPPDAREPTPGTVTRDNPAGDADSPVDAALTRLLEQPIGERDDKFKTLRPRLADARNWKRVRFWGHPTRASFRYGEDGYALAIILYSEAEDDRPRSCLQKALQRGRRLTQAFHIELGPLEREERTYPPGIEALDFERLEEATDRRFARYLEKAERRRKRLKRWRAKRIARMRLARKRRDARDRSADGHDREPGGAEDGNEQATKKDGEAAKKKDGEAAKKKDGEAAKKASGTDRRAKKKSAAEKKKAQRRKKRRRKHVRHVVMHRLIDELEPEPMPVIRTSGRFHTLFDDDRYLAAIVAYRSWPGTCLVQGFAARVGTDEALTRRVVERWLEKQAPGLRWRHDLDGKPAIENR